ncbi:MAG: hypothetical protein LUQ39_06395 [Methanomassiliicoccales archaeon]|nr:hypothetical protein [Methanomassiliicoccales archaeon]
MHRGPPDSPIDEGRDRQERKDVLDLEPQKLLGIYQQGHPTIEHVRLEYLPGFLFADLLLEDAESLEVQLHEYASLEILDVIPF